MTRRRVAIVGAGAFGLTHARAIASHADLELHGVFSQSVVAARDLATRFDARTYSALDEMLEDDLVDGVIIATPHATHADLGVRVLNSGVHVLIEKPLAVTVAECETLIAVEHSSVGRGMVGHLMRWAPAHRRARELVAAGAIGEVRAVDSRRVIPWRFDERRPWHRSAAAGGGMWLVQGVHVIDQLCWLLDGEPERAIGRAKTLFHPQQDADDYGSALIEFGGVAAQITLAGVKAGFDQVYTDLFGTEGMLRVSHRGELHLDRGSGVEDLTEKGVDHWAATLRGELDAFAAMLNGAPAEPDFTYGRRIAATVEAVHRSQSTGSWAQVER